MTPSKLRSSSAVAQERRAPARDRWAGALALGVILIACLGARPRPEPAAHLSSAQRARLYHRWAEEALTDPSVEARQRAARDIGHAIRLEPQHAGHWRLLGRIKVLGEYDSEARDCFRRAIVLDPGDLAGYLELGAAWKREWLRTLDPLAFQYALGILDTAAARRPTAADPWLAMVPLLYERSDVAAAARAAERALAGRPRRPESMIAAALVAHRQGDVARSDSLFRFAIPRLDGGLEPLFLDPAAMLGAAAPPAGWAGLDPDPTTPENEIQLEYWSRVAHAFLLFYDTDRPGWDGRALTYVQYGPPRTMEHNPTGTPLYFRSVASSMAKPATREAQLGGSKEKPPMEFPTPIQAWQYPELGMRVVLQDRSLHGRFQPRSTPEFDPGSRPDPALLAARHDLVSIGGGAAVFHRLPPLERRIETRAVVARFEGARGPRLLAQVEVPGGPSDSLQARWLVSDASGRPVARGQAQLAVAACDPAERRSAQFTADVPAGAHRVTISVRGAEGRAGLFQIGVALEPDPPGLGLSDLVLACGEAGAWVGSPSARFDANVEARVAGGGTLAGYLEIYRLAPDADGVARFTYTCEVRRLDSGRRPGREKNPVVLSISRDETHVGPVRRQFVRVPAQTIPAGRYQLEVRVRDQVSGAEEPRSAAFVRE